MTKSTTEKGSTRTEKEKRKEGKKSSKGKRKGDKHIAEDSQQSNGSTKDM